MLTLTPDTDLRYDVSEFDLCPLFDALCRDLELDPFTDQLMIDNGVDLVDAFDRSDIVPDDAPLSWFPPTDLMSLARSLAASMDTTYTTYTRENAEALRWMVENGGPMGQPASVSEWMARNRPQELPERPDPLWLPDGPELESWPSAVTTEPDLTALRVPTGETALVPMFKEPTTEIEEVAVDGSPE